jgi:hypothetical protein
VAFLFARHLSQPRPTRRPALLPTAPQADDAQRWSIACATARIAHFLIRGAASARHPSVHARGYPHVHPRHAESRLRQPRLP